MFKCRILGLVVLVVVFAACRVDAGPAVRVYIAPSSVGLTAGAVQEFKVYSVDAEGCEIQVKEGISWAVDAKVGTIDQNGRFTASSELEKYPGALLVSAAGLIASADIETVDSRKENGYTFLRRLGGPVRPGHLNHPQWVALDSANNLYVLDTAESRISVYDEHGRCVRYWEINSGQCGGPSGITIDQKDNIYVTDSGEVKLYKYNTAGEILGSWPLHISGDDDRCCCPEAVAVDKDGFIYIADSCRSAVLKFDPNCAFVSSWGGDDSEFCINNPEGLAIGKDGSIYASGCYGGSVLVFDTSGRFLDKWGAGHEWMMRPGWRSGDGLFNQPTGVAVAPGGEVYVADWTGGNVQKFSPEGRRLAKWGKEGDAPGEFSDPWGLAVDKQGYVYVADSDNHRIQKLDPQGTVVAHWGDEGNGNGSFIGPRSIAFDSKRNIYIIDCGNKRIQKFDSNWTFIASWKPSAESEWEFLSPDRIVVDSRDNVYVADPGVGKVMKFSSDGKPISVWSGQKLEKSDEEYYSSSRLADVAVGPDGHVYALNTGTWSVEKYNTDGSFISKFSLGENDNCSASEELVIDSKGNIYVLDDYKNNILTYDPSGMFLYDLIENLRQSEILQSPGRIYISPDDKVYVRDYCAGETYVLSTGGELLSVWNVNPGGLDLKNYGLPTFDSRGNLYMFGPDHQVFAFSPVK